MAWTTDQVTCLIEAYRKNPSLYMVKHPQYHKRDARQAAMESVVKELEILRPQTNTTEVLKKWNGLRNTYITERRKYINSIHSGMDKIEVSPLIYI